MHTNFCAIPAAKAAGIHLRSQKPSAVVENENKLAMEKRSAGNVRSTHTSAQKGRIEIERSIELFTLSVLDRSAIEEEIHGVRSLAIESHSETPELIASSLSQFDAELGKIKRARIGGNGSCSHDVLRNVTTTNSESKITKVSNGIGNGDCYLNDPFFRLRFLRCELFDAHKASQRFVRFLEFCSDLFGSFVGERPILIDDLIGGGFKEKKALLHSSMQYFPCRDRSGRRVCADVGLRVTDLPSKQIYKIITWIHLVATQDIETQQKGVVFIVLPSSKGNDGIAKYVTSTEFDSMEYHKKSFESLPVRVASIHFCSKDSPFCEEMAYRYFSGVPKDLKIRFKVHQGDHTEIEKSLSGFGIPINFLPLTSEGKIKKKVYHRNFVKFHVETEVLLAYKSGYLCSGGTINGQTNGNDARVDCPRSYDVVFRAGKKHVEHPGNAFMLESIIQSTYHHYVGLRTAKEKSKFCRRIVTVIENKKIRFLDWDMDRCSWIHIRHPTLMQKKVVQSYLIYARKTKREGLSSI